MITYQKESLETLWNDLMKNARDHWMETEGYRHDQKFNPDKKAFLHYESIGFYHAWTARDEGKLIGHITMYVSKSMHTQVKAAMEDTLFIHPAYRGKHVCLKLIKMMEHEMEEMGIKEIMFTTKLVNSAGKLIERMGYTHVANQYSKSFNTDIKECA